MDFIKKKLKNNNDRYRYAYNIIIIIYDDNYILYLMRRPSPDFVKFSCRFAPPITIRFRRRHSGR